MVFTFLHGQSVKKPQSRGPTKSSNISINSFVKLSFPAET